MHLSSMFEKFTMFPLYPMSDGKCMCGRPCNAPGKHPMVAWSKLQPAEKKLGPVGCGYGIATGAKSGIVVIDTDVKNGIDGEANLLKLGPMPETYTVRTPTGGFHRYYLHPGRPVRCSQGELAPGVDVRGDGGFVVAPGSLHKNGGVYTMHVNVAIGGLVV